MSFVLLQIAVGSSVHKDQDSRSAFWSIAPENLERVASAFEICRIDNFILPPTHRPSFYRWTTTCEQPGASESFKLKYRQFEN